MLLNRDFNTKLVRNESVLSMKFDSSVYRVSTVSAGERRGLWCVCVCVCVCVGWGSLKVSNSETGREVGVY
jgi:hypothetical protein